MGRDMSIDGGTKGAADKPVSANQKLRKCTLYDRICLKFVQKVHAFYPFSRIIRFFRRKRCTFASLYAICGGTAILPTVLSFAGAPGFLSAKFFA